MQAGRWSEGGMNRGRKVFRVRRVDDLNGGEVVAGMTTRIGHPQDLAIGARAIDTTARRVDQRQSIRP